MLHGGKEEDGMIEWPNDGEYETAKGSNIEEGLT